MTGESFLHAQAMVALMERLTPENLPEVLTPLLDGASEIWGMVIDVRRRDFILHI